MTGKILARNKKEAAYKLCLALIIAVLAAALYFNITSTIERKFLKTDARAFNFNLYDKKGNLTEFSKFRGNIVFMVFWTPQNMDSVLTLEGLSKEFAADGAVSERADKSAGAPGVVLISVCSPAGYEIPDVSPDDGEARRIYELIQYVDISGELTDLFLVGNFPATYVFKPSGELCDYRVGAADEKFIGDMLRKAGE